MGGTRRCFEGARKGNWANLVDVSHSSTSQVNAHCYESVDLDDFVRVSEELNLKRWSADCLKDYK